MGKIMNKLAIGFGACMLLLFMGALKGEAAIVGTAGATFDLTAKAGTITIPDGGNIYMWGYALDGGLMQYPGPTLVLDEDVPVTITLQNQLPVEAGNVSIIFPGHTVTASGGVAGAMTQEAEPDGVTIVTYTFTPEEPGTYTYFSGTWMDMQVPMGLAGTIIVRPTGAAGQAYADPATTFDREYLFFLSDIDPSAHNAVAGSGLESVDTTGYWPVYWFINGRAAPDTMLPNNVPWLPHQPLNAPARMHPGDRVLLRIVGSGRDLHPFHYHGNNADIIAEDGRVYSSIGNAGPPDLAESDFTITIAPGKTFDLIFQWTGENLGWDIYGAIDTGCTDADNNGFDDGTGEFCHDANCTDAVSNVTGIAGSDGFDDATYEFCADHGTAFPVTLPSQREIALGGMYSGSPFLGDEGVLPPGEGGLNPNAGYFFMWHSHNEKEMVNNDIFPGGMMTFGIIEPPGVAIP